MEVFIHLAHVICRSFLSSRQLNPPETDWYFPCSRGTVPCWSPACHLSYNKVAPFPSPSNLKEEEVLIVGYPIPLRRAVKDHPFLH
ncbi:hypothetical protein J6590_033769 [Homalodisca vitripennis]|nr:hypothetical protein J6590_033769 [Homalodisca vitripennis]